MSSTPNVPVTPTGSSNPLFGRKYNLTVKSAPDSSGNQTVYTVTDSAFEPEALRITFDVRTAWWTAYWAADICIYNPNEQLANFLITQGGQTAPPAGAPASSPNSGAQTTPIQQNMEVVLSAGYLNGNYGVIWDGYVLQPLFEIENQTDFKITLHCVVGLNEDARNVLNGGIGTAFATNVTQQNVVESMAANAYYPISTTANSFPDSLSQVKLPRGKVVFGRPGKYLSEIARQANVNWWLGSLGILNMKSFTNNLSPSPIIQYTPQTGLIGTPQQTQNGATFRLLMDPRVAVKNPPIQVNINNAVTRQLLKQVGDLPTLLSQDGTYVVVGVRYRGDSRGNEWYADVTGQLTAIDRTAVAENIYIGA